MTPDDIVVEPHAAGFGARVTGVDLSMPLPPRTLAQILEAWTRHSVVYFPDQPLSLEALERFTLQIGPFGADPFIKPMPGHANILEVRRDPDERTHNFGAGWHSDWSFQVEPPAATILHAKVIPPVGGDTLYADGYRAYDALPEATKATLAQLRAMHTAKAPYGRSGFYTAAKQNRAMEFFTSDEAETIVSHPVVRTHPVSGRKALFVNRVYTVGIEHMGDDESRSTLNFLFQHMVREQLIYRHRWAHNMLTLWDNRCTVHFAEGGYDGHLRIMHRTTVAGTRPQ